MNCLALLRSKFWAQRHDATDYTKFGGSSESQVIRCFSNSTGDRILSLRVWVSVCKNLDIAEHILASFIA